MDSKTAFKSFCVTNALDGSDNHLVFEKLSRQIGTGMLSFGAELLAQLHPESLEGVVRNLILPKGIKKRNSKE